MLRGRATMFVGAEFRECAPFFVHLDLVKSLRKVGTHVDDSAAS